MKKPKVKHRPRKLRARPLLVAAALSLAPVAGCYFDGVAVHEPAPDLSMPAAPADLGLPPHD